MSFHYNVATEGVRAGFRSFSVLGLRYFIAEALENFKNYVKRIIFKNQPNTEGIEKVIHSGESSVPQQVEMVVQFMPNTSKIGKEQSEISATRPNESISIVRPSPNAVSITKSKNKIKI